MHFCTENVRPTLFLWKGIKRKKVNQKPNHDVVLFNFQRGCINEIVWYQAIHSQKCRSNCLFIQIVLAFVAIKYIEFQKCSFICLDILKRWYFDLDWKTLLTKFATRFVDFQK